jgi:hypothetical protein
MKTFAALLALSLVACTSLEAPTVVGEITVAPWGSQAPAAVSRRAFSFAESPCRPEIEEAFALLQETYGIELYEDPAGTPIILSEERSEGGTTFLFGAKEDIEALRVTSPDSRAQKIELGTCLPIVIAHEALHACGLLHYPGGLMDGDGVGNWDLTEEQIAYVLSLP